MYQCPVCGWNKLQCDPKTGDHEICPCCSTQFGYSDSGYDFLESAWKILFAEWFLSGCNFWHISEMPEGWSSISQLDSLKEYWKNQ